MRGEEVLEIKGGKTGEVNGNEGRGSILNGEREVGKERGNKGEQVR